MSLPVVRRFVSNVEQRAVGTNVIKGVRPDQQVRCASCDFTLFLPRCASRANPVVGNLLGVRPCRIAKVRKKFPSGQSAVAMVSKATAPKKRHGANDDAVVCVCVLVWQLVKFVSDELLELMGKEAVPLNEAKSGPTVILMAGLQVRWGFCYFTLGEWEGCLYLQPCSLHASIHQREVETD